MRNPVLGRRGLRWRRHFYIYRRWSGFMLSVWRGLRRLGDYVSDLLIQHGSLNLLGDIWYPWFPLTFKFSVILVAVLDPVLHLNLGLGILFLLLMMISRFLRALQVTLLLVIMRLRLMLLRYVYLRPFRRRKLRRMLYLLDLRLLFLPYLGLIMAWGLNYDEGWYLGWSLLISLI